MKHTSYSLGLVTDFLDQLKITYEFSSGGCHWSLCETGCRINLTEPFELSIQTDPAITGSAFAETALISTKTRKVCYGPCGYGDVKTHDTPEELFKEIEWLLTQHLTEIDESSEPI